jgi:glycosyltransferase involved in cell wall biosynthesis
MKKILHLTHTDIRSDSRILKEMQSAITNGYSVYGIGIRLSEGSTASNVDLDNVTALNIRSKKLVFLPDFLRHFFTLIEFFFKTVVIAVKVRADIVHCNDTLVLPVGCIIKVLTRARLVYDAHELESNRNGLSPLLGKMTLLAEKFCWSLIDGLVVVSPSIEAWYEREVGSKRSIVVLNSPVYDATSLCEGNDYLRERFQITQDSKIFIYVGILGEGRGIDLITKSFESNPQSHVVFLGYGEYREKLDTLCARSANIHIHEAVEHSKVVEIASSADVGLCLIQNVSLSDYYCLPNKLFEYAFAGLDVLASNFPDISKIVSDYSLGVCVDLNEESIENGIAEFESRDIKRSDTKPYLHDLSWESQELKLLELYKEISE